MGGFQSNARSFNPFFYFTSYLCLLPPSTIGQPHLLWKFAHISMWTQLPVASQHHHYSINHHNSVSCHHDDSTNHLDNSTSHHDNSTSHHIYHNTSARNHHHSTRYPPFSIFFWNNCEWPEDIVFGIKSISDSIHRRVKKFLSIYKIHVHVQLRYDLT